MRYRAGVWNVRCDICGFVKKSDEVKIDRDNRVICLADVDVYQQLSSLKPHEKQTVANTNSEPADVFLDTKDWQDEDIYNDPKIF